MNNVIATNNKAGPVIVPRTEGRGRDRSERRSPTNSQKGQFNMRFNIARFIPSFTSRATVDALIEDLADQAVEIENLEADVDVLEDQVMTGFTERLGLVTSISNAATDFFHLAAALQDIVAKVDSIAVPNGSTKALGRMAAEALTKTKAQLTPETRQKFEELEVFLGKVEAAIAEKANESAEAA